MRCACQGKIGGLKGSKLDEFGGRIGLTGLLPIFSSVHASAVIVGRCVCGILPSLDDHNGDIIGKFFCFSPYERLLFP